jgi:hypothetical protein
LEEKFHTSFMERNGKKTLIQRIFIGKLTQIYQFLKIPKIPNHHF